MNYRFHRAGLAEHLDEVAFYESRLPGLGADYLAEFDATMARVCAAPDLYPRLGADEIRKAGLKRFPFDIIYTVTTSSLIVLAVAHQRRRPSYWVGRIGQVKVSKVDPGRGAG